MTAREAEVERRLRQAFERVIPELVAVVIGAEEPDPIRDEDRAWARRQRERLGLAKGGAR